MAIFRNVADDVGLLFQRQLELIKSKTFDIEYPELKAKKLFPVDNEGNAGVESIVYRQFDKVGKMKFIDGLGKDLPLVDVKSKEFRLHVKTFAGGFKYNIEELNRSKYANVPLSQQKANVVREAYEKLVNDVAFYGVPDLEIKGFFDLYKHNAVVKSAKGFKDMTADEIIGFINGLRNRVYTSTLMVEQPNCLVMDPLHLTYISSQRLGTYSDTTILEFLLEKCPWLEGKRENVIDVNEFHKTSEVIGEVAGSDIIAVYRRDPEKIQLAIPSELMYLPVQEIGIEYHTYAYGTIAGIEAYYPKGIQFGTIPNEDTVLMQEMESSSVKQPKKA